MIPNTRMASLNELFGCYYRHFTYTFFNIIMFIFIYYFNYTFIRDEKPHSNATVSVVELWPLEFARFNRNVYFFALRLLGC